jgi:predicted  nucleic acid-binding Zn-ribbon protein
MSTGAQRILTIYIRPLDGGPIKPVRVDLMEIEMLALRNPDNSQRDEIRVKELARQIKEQCQGMVYPEKRRDQLATLLRGLAHYLRFNGVVLDVPGTTADEIDGAGRGLSMPEAVKQQLEEVKRQAAQISRDLRAEREAHEDTREQLAIVKNNYKNMRSLYDKAAARLEEAQRREAQARQDADLWQKTARRVTDEANETRREVGRLQIQHDLAREEVQRTMAAFQEQRQAWVNKDRELSELRQHALEMESALKHLEEALKKRDQELELLRQALLDDQPAGVLAPGAEGWDKTL